MGCQTPDRHHVMEKGPGPTGEIDCSCGSRLATFAQFAEHVEQRSANQTKRAMLEQQGQMAASDKDRALYKPLFTNPDGINHAGFMGKMHQPPTLKNESPAAIPYGAPISKEELLAYRKRLFAKLDEVLLAKGNDYNSAQQNAGDTLFNLRVCAMLGIVPTPEDGVLVRLADKLMRVVSLTRPAAIQKVKDESIEDTIGDAINYLSYLSAMIIKSRRGTL